MDLPGIESRHPGLKYDGLLGDVAPADWVGEIDQVLVQGTRICVRSRCFTAQAAR